MRPRRPRPMPAVQNSAFAGLRFPPDIIVLAVLWYLPYTRSYRDVEESLAERGIEADRITIYRASAIHATPRGRGRPVPPLRSAIIGMWTRPTRRSRAGGAASTARSTSLRQIIDLCLSPKRDFLAARRFFVRATRAHREPAARAFPSFEPPVRPSATATGSLPLPGEGPFRCRWQKSTIASSHWFTSDRIPVLLRFSGPAPAAADRHVGCSSTGQSLRARPMRRSRLRGQGRQQPARSERTGPTLGVKPSGNSN